MTTQIITNQTFAIAQSIINNIVVTKPATKRIRTFAGFVTNPKTKKGKVKRFTPSFVELGFDVVDTAATLRARREAEKTAIAEAMGIDLKVKDCAKQKAKEKEDAIVFEQEMTAYEQDCARIDTQLKEYKEFVPARVGTNRSINHALVKAPRIGSPSAGAIRNAKRRARGLAQAKKMVARGIVSRYTRVVHTNIVSQTTSVIAAPAFGTAVQSLYDRVDIVCSAANTPDPSAMHGSEDSRQESIITGGTSMTIDKYMTAEQIASITEEELNELNEMAHDDYGCAIYGSIEQAFIATIEDYFGSNPESSAMLEREDSHESPDLTDTVVKPSASNNNGGNMSFTKLIADYIFGARESSIKRSDISEEQAAKAAAKRAQRTDDFVAHFGELLIAPTRDNIVLIGDAETKRALSGTNGRIKDYINLFNCYGVDEEGNPLELKFGKDMVAEAKPEDLEDFIMVDNGSEFFAHEIAVATHALSVEDKVRFILAMAKNDPAVKATAHSAVIGDATFNFALGTVTTGTNHQVANPVIEINGAEFDGSHAVFLLALTAVSNTSAVKWLVNHAVSLFERDENYGAKLSDIDLANGVARNYQLATDFASNTAHGKFPFYAMSAGKQDDHKLSEVLAKGQMAVVDKYNMKWMSKGIGAEAVLVGRNGDTILNLNDANKTSKVYNRPASIKYTFADVLGRTKSNFAVALSDGTKAYSCGRKLRTVWSNSRFGHGSGVAVINPDLTFDFVVGKSLRGVFNILTLPASLRGGNYKEIAEQWATTINGKIDALIGEEFAPGKPVLTIENGDETHTIIRNNNNAVTLRVKGGQAIATSLHEVDVKLDVEIVGSDEQYVKLRGIGKKCTTLPYEVSGLGNDWDILLNIEAVKGYPALVEMYSNHFGIDCHYHSNTGILNTPDGAVDLKEVDNQFTKWAKESTNETIISFEMARSCYEDLKAVIEDHEAPTLAALRALVGSGKGLDVFVEDVNATTVRVHERVEYIVGEIVFDVEVSTPKESLGTTHLTMEAANGILLQDKALGEAILKDLEAKALGAESLVAAFLKSGRENLPTFNVSTVEGRANLRAAFGETVPAGRTGFANHRAIINELGKNKALVNGFNIAWNVKDATHSFEVHPRALAAFGGFSNGSATREIAAVVDFLYTITDDVLENLSGRDTVISAACFSVMNKLKYWASNLVQSSNCMKKMTRSGKLVGGKVRTTYSPILNDRRVMDPATGEFVTLPVVAINPKGNFAKLLKAKEGEIVGVTRTPMPFMTAAILIFSEDVPDAHVWVSPKVWHAANEGDSDGDGITLMNLARYGVGAARAAKINASLMGPAGYHFVYGNELPVYEFSSHKDKWGNKKSTTVWETPVVSTMSVEEYGAGAALVSTHYKYNVGISYAVCSQLVFAAVNQLYTSAESASYDALVQATVVAWRLIYEGLGLSGYSPAAKEFFNILNVAAFSFETGKVNVSNDPDQQYVMPWAVKEKRAAGFLVKEVDGIEMLLHGEGIGLNGGGNISRAAIFKLLRSRATCMTYRKIETKGDKSFAKKDARRKLLVPAVLIGCLRRLGQGNDPVEVTEAAAQEREESGNRSLFRIFASKAADFSALIACPPMRAIATQGIALHAAVTARFEQMAANNELS